MSHEYQYEFADGTVAVIQLSEEWLALLRELDRLEKNNDQSERRRHCSLERYSSCDSRISLSYDAFGEVEEADAWETMCGELTRQEVLIGDLYFRKGYHQQELADVLRLSQSRVARVITNIRWKLKNFSCEV